MIEKSEPGFYNQIIYTRCLYCIFFYAKTTIENCKVNRYKILLSGFFSKLGKFPREEREANNF